MKVTAIVSDGFAGALEGRAIGDEFTVSARARIVGAEEALLDVTPAGARDAEYVQGELEVRLLLSHAEVEGAPA